MIRPLLFVYGTLRPAFAGEMAAWLGSVAECLGAAHSGGALYRIADYPGFIPGPGGMVMGELYRLPDAEAILAALDEHEECAAHFPLPHEYRREYVRVQWTRGPINAWTYVYARGTAGLERIGSGDFLA